MAAPKQASIRIFLFTAGVVGIVREAMAPPTPTGVAHITTSHTRTSLIIHEIIHQGGAVGALCIENEWTEARIASEPTITVPVTLWIRSTVSVVWELGGPPRAGG